MSYSSHFEERSSKIPPRSHHSPVTSAVNSNDASTSRQAPVVRHDALIQTTTALPSLATLAGEVENTREQRAPGYSAPWRPLGVRNILNPASESQVQQFQHVAPSPPTTTNLGLHEAPTKSPHIRKRGEPHSSVNESHSQQNARPGRRTLTPRSPGKLAQRAASLGSHRSPSVGAGFINRVPLPQGEGHGYTAEPGDSRDAAIPPLPPLSSATRGSFAVQQNRETGSSTLQGPNTGPNFSPINSRHHPQDDRGEQNRPPYAGAESHHPGFPLGHATMPHTPVPGSADNQNAYLPPTTGSGPPRIPYGPTEYQLTFETRQGPVVVPVNVDYQQASRQADEKRKRNAGASARFRARRKEKEREANSTISGLQQELQELMDEREFYRGERDFFRNLLARSNPGPLPARPRSPQPRRAPTFSSNVSETGSNLDYGRHETEVQESQRRRTGEYQPSIASQSPSTPYNRPYPPSGPPMTLPTPTSTGNYSDPRAGPPGPGPQSTRPPPYDPLRRNVLDRDWNAGR